jgi:hypothetical protein
MAKYRKERTCPKYFLGQAADRVGLLAVLPDVFLRSLSFILRLD